MTEESLFQEALSRSPAERAAFLAQACAGRPELRAMVEALVAAHELRSTIGQRVWPRRNRQPFQISSNVFGKLLHRNVSALGLFA